MLAEGRHVANEGGITNIRWLQAPAEDLPAAAPGPYRLVTFGQSLDWTDETQVADAVYEMLAPGGALALIVHTVEGRPVPPAPGPPPIPHAEIKALVEKYLGTTKRAGQGTAPVRTARRFEDLLVRTRFGMPQVIFVPGIADLVRTSESVLSGYFSMSFSAPHLSATVSRTSPPRCGSCSDHGRPRESSGTGPATPNSSSPAGPADHLLPSRNEAMGGAWLEHATPCL